MYLGTFDAMLCLSSKNLLVLKASSKRLQRNNFTSSKTSWRHLAKTAWRRFEDFLKTSSKKSWRPLGRREIVFKSPWWNILKTSWRHVLKMSWRHALKISWSHVLKTSWRHYGDKQNTYWEYLYLTNLNVYLLNLNFTNPYLTILKQIQNASIRRHHFKNRPIL